MRHLVYSLIFVGCAGQPPQNDLPDAGGDVDAPAAPVGQNISGSVLDYFGNVSMPDSTIATDGIDPQQTTISIADGSWLLENVPTGSKVFLSVSHASYRPTRNVATTVADLPVVQDVHVMSNQDVTNQYTLLGRTPTGGRAFLAADLQLPDGLPLEGIPLENIVLVDELDQPVPNILGPVFFGEAGVIDPALLTATAFNGRSRVAILDVPPGTYTLKVTDAAQAIVSTSVTAVADGATLALSKGALPGGGNVTDPGFAADIYPRLQRAALGGTGCANCHTAGGPGAILILDTPAADVLASLLPPAPNGRIDTTTPANSLLLSNPLYEPAPPQNHPNATFLDVNDPDYKLILLWITNGLKP
jgi:hypothetical protein